MSIPLLNTSLDSLLSYKKRFYSKSQENVSKVNKKVKAYFSPVVERCFGTPPMERNNEKIKKPGDSPKPVRPPLCRKIPPVSLRDTSIISLNPFSILSEHGSTRIFEDHEIIEVHPIISLKVLGNRIFAEFTENGKAIIQQQSTRGCSGAAVAMFIMDHGKNLDIRVLKESYLWKNSQKLAALREAGLNVKEHKINLSSHLNKLETLNAFLLKNGSAIVSFGGHVVIVDFISECLSTVRIRDPYHGWEITVHSKAFTKLLSEDMIIQVIS